MVELSGPCAGGALGMYVFHINSKLIIISKRLEEIIYHACCLGLGTRRHDLEAALVNVVGGHDVE